MKQKIFAFVIATLTAVTMACTANNPAAPANNTQTGAPAPDGTTLKASAPTVVSPAGGVEIEDLEPSLTINNSTATFASGLPLSYVFEVLNSANQVIYRSSPVAQGSGGRTTHEIAMTLNPEATHTWRAWAVFQGLRSPISSDASFKTFSGLACRAPTPAVRLGSSTAGLRSMGRWITRSRSNS